MQPLLTIQGPEAALFWILAPLSVAAALGMLLVKKAVHSALLLAWVMITLAIFYIAQDAAFLGVVQVIVSVSESDESTPTNIRIKRKSIITAPV